MNWKKLLKYFFILLLSGLVVFIYLANRDLTKIYGGLTKKVNSEQFNESNTSVVIHNVQILSPDVSHFIPQQTVRIDKGIITSIDSIDGALSNIPSIDGQGKYLIPGLIDAHAHLFKSKNDLLLYLANGVTEIRELIGMEEHLEWRKEIREGQLGPDMYIASPRLGSFGAIEGFFMEWSQGFVNISNASEAERYVRSFKEKGYDGVKIYSQLNKESYDAINKVADDLGMNVMGHIPWSTTFEDIWASHQSDIAHLEEIMNALRREFGKINGQEGADDFMAYVDKRSAELAEDLIANDISVTTTLWLTKSFVRQKFGLDEVLKEVALEYQNPGISEWTKNVPQGGLGWLPDVNRYQMSEGLTEVEKNEERIFWTAYGEACEVILKNLAREGVKIMAGTDTNLPPTVPGFSLHDELKSMNEAGMTPSHVLRSATLTPATWLKSDTGKIAVGFKANLVLLDRNPLEDISHTKTINTLILGGKILDRQKLDDILTAVRLANDESRKVDISQYL